jgi:hypothetical protein
VADHPTGDDWIVVRRVDGLQVASTRDPPLFYSGGFRGLV